MIVLKSDLQQIVQAIRTFEVNTGGKIRYLNLSFNLLTDRSIPLLVSLIPNMEVLKACLLFKSYCQCCVAMPQPNRR